MIYIIFSFPIGLPRFDDMIWNYIPVMFEINEQHR